MSGRVLLSAGQQAQMTRLRTDLFATRLAVADPAVSLVLYRAGSPLTPQTVLMTRGGGRGDLLNLIDGFFEAVEPFDAETGDRFTLADGQKGEIATVWPVENGRRRADFVLDSGGRARLLASGF